MTIAKTAYVCSAIAASIGGVLLLKEVTGGGNYNGKERIDGKTVIITGANTGIGKTSATELARRGGTIIMACRDLQNCARARTEVVMDSANKKIYVEKCDLASFESIRKFVKRVNENHDKVHILINNAGVMETPKSFTKDGFETQFQTNYLGHFLLTMLLLDKLKASAPSRIINVSSVAHMKGDMNFSDLNYVKDYASKKAYQQSKLANILFTVELAERLEGRHVTCNALHPGLVNTDINRHTAVGKSWTASFLYRPIMWLFLKTPIKGAQTTVYAAVNNDLENVSGKYFSNQAEAEPSDKALDKSLSQRLWAISESWTKLS